MSYDDITPADFWRGFWKWFGVGAFVLFLVGMFILGAWRAGWWFSNQNATRDYQQTQNGTSNQETLRAQIEKNYQLLTSEDVQIAQAKGDPGLIGELKVEAAATAGTLCGEGAQVNNAVALPADQIAWFQANCSLGVVVPTSKYYIPFAA